jgi:hypothetical protein
MEILEGKEAQSKLLYQLIDTKEDIETTTEQSPKLSFYILWIFIMTGVITLCTLGHFVIPIIF